MRIAPSPHRGLKAASITSSPSECEIHQEHGSSAAPVKIVQPVATGSKETTLLFPTSCVGSVGGLDRLAVAKALRLFAQNGCALPDFVQVVAEPA
jgi:hypothetical protein